jgi:two-component system nitrate/nitrite response regulator NarL
MRKKIRLLLIEDNRLLRAATAGMLHRQRDLQIVGSVPGDHTAVAQALLAAPDIILLDNFRWLALARRMSTGSRVIVTDLDPAQQDIRELLRAGIAGFLLKDATPDHYLRVIRAVAGGSHVLPVSLSTALLAHIAEPAASRNGPETSNGAMLTRREREMLELIAEGLSNKAIAQRLGIATNTVKGHVHQLLRKLALHTRLEVATRARRAGPWSEQQARPAYAGVQDSKPSATSPRVKLHTQ